MSDSPKILMEEMFRIAQQPASFTYKPAEGWTDPDITLHYSSVEEFDALCIGETVDGQPLYYGYTVEQIKQMSEWNLTASERHFIGTTAKDATAHLLGLVRYIRHKQEQGVKNYDPFWLVKLCFPNIFTNPTPAFIQSKDAPKLLVMPTPKKRGRGRPTTPLRDKLLVYLYTREMPKVFLCYEKYADQEPLMPFELVEAMMNEGVDPNSTAHRTAKRYSQIYQQALKEAKDDPELYQWPWIQVLVDEGYTKADFIRFKETNKIDGKLENWMDRKREAMRQTIFKMQNTGKFIQ